MMLDNDSRAYWEGELNKLKKDDWPYLNIKITRGDAATKHMSLPVEWALESLLNIDFLQQSKELFKRYDQSNEESLRIIREQRELMAKLKKELKK